MSEISIDNEFCPVMALVVDEYGKPFEEGTARELIDNGIDVCFDPKLPSVTGALLLRQEVGPHVDAFAPKMAQVIARNNGSAMPTFLLGHMPSLMGTEPGLWKFPWWKHGRPGRSERIGDGIKDSLDVITELMRQAQKERTERGAR